ncbi:unannotated protein [freshwater metagenome]|uniref:Unannotated protein n=1 Tax=freshwater metagenome TaxID=449393 RepID=A0A6J7J335_9ZZZZ
MARDDCAGQCIVIGCRPTEVSGGGADDDTGVGDATGHHDVGTGVQAFHDSPRTEVGVCRQRAAEAEFACPAEEVVAVHVGDLRAGIELLQRLDQSARIESAGIGHDLHALVECQSEAVLGLPQKGFGVATGRVLHSVASENEHGQLGEVVTGEVIEVSSLEHLPHRGQSISVETGAVAYTYGHAFSRPALSRPCPGGPAKAWAMVSQCAASAPSARTSRSSRCAR